jgi:D-alanyl-D-alanine carboxypeptidase
LEQEAQSAMHAIPSPGIALAVQFPDHERISVFGGVGNLVSNEAINPKSLFRIWSVSKTMTAAVVLQLVDEGRLNLNDTIIQWFPDIPMSSQITLGHLLSHTSGIPNFTDSSRVSCCMNQHWSPQELMDIAMGMPRSFRPGDGWEYSNSNYVLMALVIEKVTASPLQVQLRKRLFDPLRLNSTFVWGEEEIPNGYVLGYDSDAHGGFVDVTNQVHPSVAWASGAIVSNIDDLLTWTTVFFEGKLLSKKTQKLMVTRVKLNDGRTVDYGLGIEIQSTPWGTRFGKGGGPLKGYTAVISYLAGKGAAAVAIVNTANPMAGKTVMSSGWKSILRQ